MQASSIPTSVDKAAQGGCCLVLSKPIERASAAAGDAAHKPPTWRDAGDNRETGRRHWLRSRAAHAVTT